MSTVVFWGVEVCWFGRSVRWFRRSIIAIIEAK